MQHFPEIGDGNSLGAYAELARQAESRVVIYGGSAGFIDIIFLYSPKGPARMVKFNRLVEELELDFIQRLELESELGSKA